MTSHKGKGNRRLRVCGAVANNSSLITSLGIGWRGWGNVFRFRDYAIDFARARHSPTPFYNSPLLPRDVTLMSKKYPWIGYFLVIYIKTRRKMWWTRKLLSFSINEWYEFLNFLHLSLQHERSIINSTTVHNFIGERVRRRIFATWLFQSQRRKFRLVT